MNKSGQDTPFFFSHLQLLIITPMNYRISTIVLTSICIVLGSMTADALANNCFVIEPYVLHTDESSAKIVWVTPPGIDAGSVMYKKGEEQEEHQVTAQLSVPRFQHVTRGELDYQRHLAVLQDLESFSKYYYDVDCGDGTTFLSGTFMTAPEPGETPDFQFVVMSDAHANRITDGQSRHAPVAQAVGQESPAFTVMTGDYGANRGDDWDTWLPYFVSARPYLENSVHWAALGNHDARPNRNFRSLFAFNDPDGNPADEDNKGTWYSFTFGNLEFFILDHYERESSLAWVKKALASSTADWKIIGFHDSIMSVGGRPFMRSSIYDEYARVFEKYGVDLVFYGHDHIYERSIPFGSEGVKPVFYICTTSGGGGFRTVRPSPVVAGGMGLIGLGGGLQETAYEKMYALVSINDNRLEMKAKLPDGTVIDSLELIKNEEGLFQEEIMRQAIDMEMVKQIAHVYTGSYSDRTVREDLYANILDVNEESDSVRVLLDTSRFPEGSELIVYGQKSPSGWRVEEQVISITGAGTILDMVMPENITVVDGEMRPALELHVNLRVDGREFDPVTIIPTVTESFLSIHDAVILESPRDGAVRMPLQPELEWQAVPLAPKYQLQVAKNNFLEANIQLDTLVSSTTFSIPFELEGAQLYRWRVRVADIIDGAWSENRSFTTLRPVSAETDGDIPGQFSLSRNYPNPFNPSTVITYGLPVNAHVTLRIYDVLGRLLSVLVNEEQNTGYHKAVFNIGSFSSGVYLYQLEAVPSDGLSEARFSEAKFMTIIK